MRRSIALGTLLTALGLGIAPLAAQTVTSIFRASVDAQGEGGLGTSQFNSISPNGRFVVFSSSANNLVPGDTAQIDIFLRDLQSNTIQRVNTRAGQQADLGSSAPVVSALSPNGFLAVAFESDSTNLVRDPSLFPDDNDATDIYFSLPLLGIIERVSIGNGVTQANGPSLSPSIAIRPEPNLLYVAYSSVATNLVAGDANDSISDIYLTTIQAPARDQDFNPGSHVSTIKVSRAAVAGQQPNGDSSRPYISGDGRWVVYDSSASNVVSGAVSTARQIYLFDALTGQTSLISRSAAGAPGNGDSAGASISFNGTYVLYQTTATNILSDGIVAPGPQVVRFDARAGTSVRVNVNAATAGSASTSSDREAFISADGRLVSFADNSSQLVPNDTNGVTDMFARDMSSSAGPVRLSVSSSGQQGDGASSFPAAARQGYTSSSTLVGFSSDAANLVPADDEARRDTFLTALTLSPLALSPRTLLEVPPGITVGATGFTARFESFSGSRLRARAAGRAAAARKRPAIRYLTTVTSQDGSNQVRRRVSKRNELTFPNLAPGTYSVSYQAQIRRGTRVVRRTNFSPSERIRIGG